MCWRPSGTTFDRPLEDLSELSFIISLKRKFANLPNIAAAKSSSRSLQFPCECRRYFPTQDDHPLGSSVLPVKRLKILLERLPDYSSYLLLSFLILMLDNKRRIIVSHQRALILERLLSHFLNSVKFRAAKIPIVKKCLNKMQAVAVTKFHFSEFLSNVEGD